MERISGRRPGWVPTTENRDGGHDFYRFADGFYRWSAHERGVPVFERSTRSQDRFVGWIAISLVRDCATAHELAHRVEGEDSRRQWFGLWEEWARALDPQWGDEVAARVAGILRTAPFVDRPVR
nr:Imm63 family immunity protein [Nocardioides luti]